MEYSEQARKTSAAINGGGGVEKQVAYHTTQQSHMSQPNASLGSD
jgi:hypothetical protein